LFLRDPGFGNLMPARSGDIDFIAVFSRTMTRGGRGRENIRQIFWLESRLRAIFVSPLSDFSVSRVRHRTTKALRVFRCNDQTRSATVCTYSTSKPLTSPKCRNNMALPSGHGKQCAGQEPPVISNVLSADQLARATRSPPSPELDALVRYHPNLLIRRKRVCCHANCSRADAGLLRKCLPMARRTRPG
jgi:hypothetical protein